MHDIELNVHMPVFGRYQAVKYITARELLHNFTRWTLNNFTYHSGPKLSIHVIMYCMHRLYSDARTVRTRAFSGTCIGNLAHAN